MLVSGNQIVSISFATFTCCQFLSHPNSLVSLFFMFCRHYWFYFSIKLRLYLHRDVIHEAGVVFDLTAKRDVNKFYLFLLFIRIKYLQTWRWQKKDFVNTSRTKLFCKLSYTLWSKWKVPCRSSWTKEKLASCCFHSSNSFTKQNNLVHHDIACHHHLASRVSETKPFWCLRQNNLLFKQGIKSFSRAFSN